jgi:hypothetical protein
MDEIDQLRKLAGVHENTGSSMGSNMSAHATNLAKYQREHNIRPGSPEWFKLWFAKPMLTGESPYGK